MLNPQQIVDNLVTITAGKPIWLAYSGGVDSHVLLHVLATTKHPELNLVSAVHVDHGLQSESKQWSKHCENVCLALGVDYQCLQVHVSDIETLGMEAAARLARYQAFEQILSSGDVLLTAQHQHDQAETLLLQLLRGAGPKGLASMAKTSSLGEVELVRPLLDVPQSDLVSYAQQHELEWIEDPSNADTRWTRNYLRHKIWPQIEQRWPQAETTLSRSAQHCAEASELLEDLAVQDMTLLNIDVEANCLFISKIMSLSPARQRNVLRHYIEQRDFSLPSTTVLQAIIDDVCLAAQDKEPLVCWGNAEARRYQDKLYIEMPLSTHDKTSNIGLKNFKPVPLQNNQSLSWQSAIGEGLHDEIMHKDLRLAYRQGGERIRLQHHEHHQSLKHLFQQWQIPPWQRDRIPLLFCGEKLVAVVGNGWSDEYAAKEGQQGYLPVVIMAK